MDETSKILEVKSLDAFSKAMNLRLTEMQSKENSFTSIGQSDDTESYVLDTIGSLRQDIQNYKFYREQGSVRKQLLVDIALKAMMLWSIN